MTLRRVLLVEVLSDLPDVTSGKHSNVITVSLEDAQVFEAVMVADGSFSEILILLKGSGCVIANSDTFPCSDRLTALLLHKCLPQGE